MNIKKAKENFQKVKDSVLKDGMIDRNEIDILLSFLEPYTRIYRSKFSTLRELLHTARESKKIDNQSDLIKALDEAENFLRTEYKIERGLGYFIAFILVLALFYAVLP